MTLHIHESTRVMIRSCQQPGMPDYLCGVYRNGDHLLLCYSIEGRELAGQWMEVALFRTITEAEAFPYTDMSNMQPETFNQLVERTGMNEICPADSFLASSFGPVRLAVEEHT